MLPYFFRRNDRITKETYLCILRTTVQQWISETSKGKAYVSQQEGALVLTGGLSA